MNVQATDRLTVRTRLLAMLSANRRDQRMVSPYSRRRMSSTPRGVSRFSKNDNFTALSAAEATVTINVGSLRRSVISDTDQRESVSPRTKLGNKQTQGRI